MTMNDTLYSPNKSLNGNKNSRKYSLNINNSSQSLWEIKTNKDEDSRKHSLNINNISSPNLRQTIWSIDNIYFAQMPSYDTKWKQIQRTEK